MVSGETAEFRNQLRYMMKEAFHIISDERKMACPKNGIGKPSW